MAEKSTKELNLIDGTLLPYRVSGKGEPVIFIHGLFGKSEDYKEVIQEVSKNYCCISFDMRGHGNSKAEAGFSVAQFAKDLRALIDFLALTNPVLVGYSTGALTIFSYLEQFGCENIKKVIFVDITPKIINDDGWSLGLYRGEYKAQDFQNDLLTMDSNFLKFASYFTYRNMTKYNEKSPYRTQASLLSKILARLLIGNDPKRRRMTKELWTEIAKSDFRKVLEEIHIPVAFFYANPGSLFSPDVAKYMQSKVKGNAIMVPFENASHALLFSHGKQFTKELMHFLQSQ